MAALQPPVGGQPAIAEPPRRRFVDVLQSQNAPDRAMHVQPPSLLHSVPTKGTHKGYPAVFFNDETITQYSLPYKWTLVGKFSQGRPTMEIIKKFFIAQDLKDQFQIGLLDSKHVLIYLKAEADFLRLYSRMTWYISGNPMRVFKWTPLFHVDKESSTVPIWFKFPKLPIQFFNKDALFFLASLFGQPLRIDLATSDLRRPSVARIQVEVDLLKSIPDRFWIGMGENHGFWQLFEADEVLPSYCQHCWRLGHEENACYVKNPELKPAPKPLKIAEPTSKKNVIVYQPKNTADQNVKVTAVTIIPSHPHTAGLSHLEKETVATDVATEDKAKLSVPTEGSLNPQQQPICPGNEENTEKNILLNPQQLASVQEHDPALLDVGNFSIISEAIDPSSSGLQQNKKEKIPVDIADDDCKELEVAEEHLVITDGLSTTSPPKVDAPIVALIPAEMLIAPESYIAASERMAINVRSGILVGEDGEKDDDERVATTPAIDLSLQGVQSTEVVKEVDLELLIMEEKGFPAQTAVMHQEGQGMNAVGIPHVSSENNSAQSFHELMKDFKESQKKINETLNKISKAKGQNAMAEGVQPPKNIQIQSDQLEDDFIPEEDDFIPVVSKKSRRRKDYSTSIKTMQTRHLPRKDYSKFNSYSTT